MTGRITGARALPGKMQRGSVVAPCIGMAANEVGMRRFPVAFFVAAVALSARAEIPPVRAPLDFAGPKLSPAGKDFVVTEFGAVGDGKTVNTAAIGKAIEA